MIGIGRRRTHRALAKAEFNSGLGHLARAANHAASGVGATVGPRVEAARDRVAPVAGKARKTASRGWGSTVTALAPLVATATDSAREAGTAAKKAKLKANARDAAKQARKQAKKNAKRSKGGSKFGKLLLAGAVVGAAGAAVARSRRARQDWEAYDPTSPVATAAERDTAPIPPASAEKPSAAVTTSTTTAAGTTREHAAKPETVGTNPVGGSTPPATANVRPAQTTPAAPATSANNNGGRS